MTQPSADEIRTATEPLRRLHSGEIYGCASCYRQEPCRGRITVDAALAHADLLDQASRPEEAVRS